MSYYMPELDTGSVTAQLQHLSNDELKQLLNDDNNQQLDDMIKEAKQLKTLEAERDVLIASNKSLAEYNLSREPVYRNARQLLNDAYSNSKAVKEEIDKKKCRLREMSRQTSLDTTLALMQTAAAEVEEETEDIANAFLNKEMSLDAFMKEFIDKRKLSHLRRIKTEKMMEHVRSQTNHVMTSSINSSSSSVIQPLRPAPPPPSSLPFATASQPMGTNFPPYPVYPQMMPQMPHNNYPFSRSAYR